MAYSYDSETDIYTVDISELDDLLTELSENTADTPYILNIEGFSSVNCLSGLRAILLDNLTKFVDLSETELPNGTVIDNDNDESFADCENLVCTPKLSNLTETDLRYMFQGCTNLKTVMPFSNDVQYLIATFSQCTSLEAIETPSAILSFESAFEGCTNLKTVIINIPSTGNKTYTEMFNGCVSLENVAVVNDTVRDNLKSILKTNKNLGKFPANVSVNVVATIPIEASTVYEVDIANLYTFLQSLPVNDVNTPYKIKVTNLTQADCVGTMDTAQSYPTVISASRLSLAIYNQNYSSDYKRYVDLSETVLPTGITSLEGAFYYNYRVVYAPPIPNTVQNLDCAFLNCVNLRNEKRNGLNILNVNINIPSGITTLYRTFEMCAIRSPLINLPSSITELRSTFYRTELSAPVSLPQNVVNLVSTFYRCTSFKNSDLRNFTIPSSVRVVSNAFDYAEVHPIVPEGVTSFSVGRVLVIPYIPSTLTTLNGLVFAQYTSQESCDFIKIEKWNLTDRSNFDTAEKLINAGFSGAFLTIQSDGTSKPKLYDYPVIYIKETEHNNMINISTVLSAIRDANDQIFTSTSYQTPRIGYESSYYYGSGLKSFYNIGDVVYPPTERLSYEQVVVYKSIKVWNDFYRQSTSEEPYKINLYDVPSNAFEKVSFRQTRIKQALNNFYIDLTISRTDFRDNGIYYDFTYAFYNMPRLVGLTIDFPEGASDFSYAFQILGFKDFRNINLPLSARKLNYAFSGNTFTYPPTLKRYGEPIAIENLTGAFYDCFGVSGIEIPSTVTNLFYAFHSSDISTPPVIPEGVTNMSYAFYNTKITTVPNIPNSVQNVSYCFEGCTYLTTVPVVPSGKTDYTRMFARCSNLTTVEDFQLTPTECQNISAVKSNSNGMFFNCNNLTAVYIKKPKTLENDKWNIGVIKNDSANDEVSVKVLDLDGNVILNKTVDTTNDSDITVDGSVDEFVHSDSEIADTLITKFRTYKKPFTENPNCLDPANPNFVLWAKDPNHVVTNLPMGGGGTDIDVYDDEEELIADLSNHDEGDIVATRENKDPAVGVPLGTWASFANDSAPNGEWLRAGSTFDANTFPALAMMLGENVVPEMFDHNRLGEIENFSLSANVEFTCEYDGIIEFWFITQTTYWVNGVSRWMNACSPQNVSDGRDIIWIPVKKGDIIKFDKATDTNCKARWYKHPLFIKATPTSTDSDYEGTLNAVRQYVTNSNSYSTDEVWTGGYWIDGKPIYRKTTTSSADVSMPYVDTVVKFEIIAKYSPENFYYDDNTDNTNTCRNQFDYVNKLWKVAIRGNSTLVHRTIYFTKTTD